MKAGVKLGILSVDDNTYSLTDTGKLVQSDIEAGGVLKDFTLMINEETRDAWRMAGMKSIQSGVDGFTEAFDVPFFEFNNNHPEQEAQFDRASKLYIQQYADTSVFDTYVTHIMRCGVHISFYVLGV